MPDTNTLLMLVAKPPGPTSLLHFATVTLSGFLAQQGDNVTLVLLGIGTDKDWG